MLALVSWVFLVLTPDLLFISLGAVSKFLTNAMEGTIGLHFGLQLKHIQSTMTGDGAG